MIECIGVTKIHTVKYNCRESTLRESYKKKKRTNENKTKGDQTNKEATRHMKLVLYVMYVTSRINHQFLSPRAGLGVKSQQSINQSISQRSLVLKKKIKNKICKYTEKANK